AEHLTDAVLLRGPGRVVNSGRAALDHANSPFGEIARVDELHRIARLAGREHFAAAIDAHRPVGEAIGLVAWTNDQPGANDQRFPGKPFLRFGFGQPLERTVKSEL